MAQFRLNPVPTPPGADADDARTGAGDRCACADAPAICPDCYAAWLRAADEAELERWLAEWDETDGPPTLRGTGVGTFEPEAGT